MGSEVPQTESERLPTHIEKVFMRDVRASPEFQISLEDDAKNILTGAPFSDGDDGALPLSILEDRVNEWIASQK